MYWPNELECSELPDQSEMCYPMPDIKKSAKEIANNFNFEKQLTNIHNSGCQDIKIECPADLKLSSQSSTMPSFEKKIK